MSLRGSFNAMKSFIERKMMSIHALSPRPPPTPSYVTNETYYSERRWLLSSIVFVTGFVITIEHFAVDSKFKSLEEIMEVEYEKIEVQQKKSQLMTAKLQHSFEKLTTFLNESDDVKKTKSPSSEHSTVTL